MNILELISSSTGFTFKKKTSKEYGGPCFNCGGGRDRFSILPDEDKFICRKCKVVGDSITFMMKHGNKTYLEACQALDIPVQPKKMRDSSLDVTPHTWEPREDTKPSAEWQEKAKAQLFQAYKFLMSNHWEAKIHRKWLNDRGISNDLIKSARMGWSLNTATFSRESWGLAPELTQKGKNKQIWMPAGLIIPYFQDGELIRLRIRQDNPTRGDRFIMVPGSSMNFMAYPAGDLKTLPGGQTHNSDIDRAPCCSVDKTPIFIVEAELDGLLLQDQLNKSTPGNAPSRGRVCAIGNSSTRPNQAAHDIISKAPQVLMCLDNDEAGDVETVWHRHQYIRAKDCRIPKEYGKDPGEAYEAGFDFAEWFDAALLPQSPKSKPPETQPTVAKNTTVDQAPEMLDTEIDADPPATTSFEEALNLVEDLPDPDDQAEIIRMGHFCIHGHYCASVKDNICLKSKLNIFTMDTCPGGFWYRESHGPVDVVILGVNFKKRT